MKKILLIEDDAVMRENTTEILGLARYEVTTAPDGKKGVELAMKLLPDLIICDIMMPKLDGYGVLHVLTKDPQTAAIPFIFLTAKAEKSEIRKGMELGADDYLTKPFEETELLNAVESRLRKNEIVKKEYAKNLEGLNRFLDEAKGLKELEGLSRKRPVVRYKKKEAVYREGDSPDHLFFLNKGKVKVYKLHEDGKEYVTGLFGSGEFFGYSALLENAAYSDAAVALEECEICKLPKDDFLALVFKNRDVAAKFIKMLSNNVLEGEKKLLSLAYDTVRRRVAEALLRLEKSYQGPGAGKKSAKLTMSRSDLAGMAGTVMETVIRCLSEFKDDKLIQIDDDGIVILDPEGLSEIP